MIRIMILIGREQPPSEGKHLLVRHRRSARDLKAVVHDITGSIFRENGFYALLCSRDEALHHARALAEEEGIPTIYIRDET